MYFHLLIDVSANILVVNQPLYHHVFSLHQPGWLELSDFFLLMLLTDGIEGYIPSSNCQFVLDSLSSSGVLTNVLVWSVITATCDLSVVFRFFLRISGGLIFLLVVLRLSF